MTAALKKGRGENYLCEATGSIFSEAAAGILAMRQDIFSGEKRKGTIVVERRANLSQAVKFKRLEQSPAQE
ncbi:hypothetical protein [Campylobacter sp.]|uniref:hypothetical protein n=1 Tax=Campylobacter sp. TaxID=205 RepID=UPI0025C4C871|nr:hypothetical protein [Campylobacter sp.]